MDRPRLRQTVLGIALTIVSLAVAVPALWRAFGPTDPVPHAAAGAIAQTVAAATTSVAAPPAPTATTTTPPTSSAEPERGRWIAQLASLRRSTSSAEVERRRADIARQTGLDAQVLDSSEYASLVPGYWVIYFPGGFPDGHAALATCTERGRTAEQSCVGRYLSHDAADRHLLCRFSDGPTSRRCARG